MLSPSSLIPSDASQPVMMMTTTGEVPGINNYRSWPKYHEGHHMPFKGCEMWNSRRRIVEADEPHFARTDLEQVG